MTALALDPGGDGFDPETGEVFERAPETPKRRGRPPKPKADVIRPKFRSLPELTKPTTWRPVHHKIIAEASVAADRQNVPTAFRMMFIAVAIMVHRHAPGHVDKSVLMPRQAVLKAAGVDHEANVEHHRFTRFIRWLLANELIGRSENPVYEGRATVYIGCAARLLSRAETRSCDQRFSVREAITSRYPIREDSIAAASEQNPLPATVRRDGCRRRADRR